jgi:hypothetical protein
MLMSKSTDQAGKGAIMAALIVWNRKENPQEERIWLKITNHFRNRTPRAILIQNLVPALARVKAKDRGRAEGQEWAAARVAVRAGVEGRAAVKGTAVADDPDGHR